MSTLYPVLTDNSTRLITGDPQAALNLKANIASPTFTGVPLSTTAAGGTNTTQIATTAFVSAAVSLAVTGLLELKGSLDCSTNPNYPAGSVGDAYLVTVAGKIGGSAGLNVDIGDTIICQTDNAGGTQAAVGASWFVLEHNLAGALLSANNLSDVASNATARTNLGLGTLATQSGTFSGTSSGTNTGDQTAVTGNAGTATALQTARAINGVSFDGTAPITVAAAAGTLTGATLASNVLASSLTSVGTLSAVAITGGAINGATVGATTPATGAFTSLSSTIGANLATSSGNVGIGTASPAGMLQVTSTAAGTVGQIIQGAASQTANLLTVKDSAGSVIGAIGSDGQMGVGGNRVASVGLFVTAGTSYGQWIYPTITSNGGVGLASTPFFSGSFTSAYGVIVSARIDAGSSVTTGYNFRIGGIYPSDSDDYSFGTEHGLYIANLSAAMYNTYGITSLVSAGDGKYNLNISGTAQNYIAGNVGIGTSSPNANAILDVSSTTKAFMPPRMTTTQKNAIASPTAGMVVYDSTLNKLSVRAASAWETVTSV